MVKIVRPMFGTPIVNGERRAEGPLGELELPVGSHVLELAGYPGIRKQVNISKNDTIRVKWE